MLQQVVVELTDAGHNDIEGAPGGRVNVGRGLLHHVGYTEITSRHRGTRSFMFVGMPHPHALRYPEVGVAVDGRGRRTIFHAMEVTDHYRDLIPPTARNL